MKDVKSISAWLDDINNAKDCIELSAISRDFLKVCKKYPLNAVKKVLLPAFSSKANLIFSSELAVLLARNPRLLDYGFYP